MPEANIKLYVNCAKIKYVWQAIPQGVKLHVQKLVNVRKVTVSSRCLAGAGGQKTELTAHVDTNGAW